MIGGGGVGAINPTNGEAGRNYGGGGSGVARTFPGTTSQSQPGAAGAAGVVIIEEFY
jgi:hypothetical protein